MSNIFSSFFVLAGNKDFYDVSLVDGYNVQMSMAPVPGTYNAGSGGHYYCGRAGCNTDLNANCPSGKHSSLFVNTACALVVNFGFHLRTLGVH